MRYRSEEEWRVEEKKQHKKISLCFSMRCIFLRVLSDCARFRINLWVSFFCSRYLLIVFHDDERWNFSALFFGRCIARANLLKNLFLKLNIFFRKKTFSKSSIGTQQTIEIFSVCCFFCVSRLALVFNPLKDKEIWEKNSLIFLVELINWKIDFFVALKFSHF